MKEYAITRVSGRPDWSAIPALNIDEQLWRPPVDIAARARLAWDDDRLYMRLEAREARIRCEEAGPLGMPCRDSCLEFFFCPVPGDPRYLNLEYNPDGCLFLGVGDGVHRARIQPEGDWFAPRTARTAEGWRVEYAVPFEFVRLFAPDFRPAPGYAIRANCYKCGDLTPREHYLAWNPCGGDAPNFHRPQDFGLMIFG